MEAAGVHGKRRTLEERHGIANEDRSVPLRNPFISRSAPLAEQRKLMLCIKVNILTAPHLDTIASAEKLKIIANRSSPPCGTPFYRSLDRFRMAFASSIAIENRDAGCFERQRLQIATNESESVASMLPGNRAGDSVRIVSGWSACESLLSSAIVRELGPTLASTGCSLTGSRTAATTAQGCRGPKARNWRSVSAAVIMAFIERYL